MALQAAQNGALCREICTNLVNAEIAVLGLPQLRQYLLLTTLGPKHPEAPRLAADFHQMILVLTVPQHRVVGDFP